ANIIQNEFKFGRLILPAISQKLIFFYQTNYVETLVKSGKYRSNSEVLRNSLPLLCEKQAESKIEQLRHLIDEISSSVSHKLNRNYDNKINSSKMKDEQESCSSICTIL